jgi:predicted GNAT family acetyltransferase
MEGRTVDEQIRVVDNSGGPRYEVRVGGRLAGFAEYRALPGHLVFTHTVVLPEFEGRGVGGRLREAESGGTVVVGERAELAAEVEHVRREAR